MVASEFSWEITFVLFVTYVIIDFVYAAYILYVNRLQAVRAATCSSILYVLLAYGVLNYTHNHWYLIPIGIGAWLGSWLLVMKEKLKLEKAKRLSDEN